MAPTDAKDDASSEPPDPNRRQFLLTTGSTVAVAVIAAHVSPYATATGQQSDFAVGAVEVTLRMNGRDYPLKIDPRTTLLDCIRESVRLTGTKKGCDHGQCGACTVHVNGRRVVSCLSLALMHDGEEITTIEGLGTPEAMHPMQAAFLACDG